MNIFNNNLYNHNDYIDNNSSFSSNELCWKKMFQKRCILDYNLIHKKLERLKLEGHSSWINCVEYNPETSKVYTGSYDHSIREFSIDTGETLGIFEGHTGWVNCLLLNIDNSILFSGSRDRTIRMWKLNDDDNINTNNDDKCIGILKGHSGGVNNLLYDDLNNLLYSTPFNGEIKCWNINTKECIMNYEGHSEFIECIKFDSTPISSNNCKHIITCSSDKTINLYNISKNEPIIIYKGHAKRVWQFQVSFDIIVSCSVDNSARIFGINIMVIV